AAREAHDAEPGALEPLRGHVEAVRGRDAVGREVVERPEALVGANAAARGRERDGDRRGDAVPPGARGEDACAPPRSRPGRSYGHPRGYSAPESGGRTTSSRWRPSSMTLPSGRRTEMYWPPGSSFRSG